MRYQLDSICKQGNGDQVREQLERLPLNLPDTYKQIWERIKTEGGGSLAIASKALAWLLCAVRPLSPAEITQAIAVELGSTHMYPVEHIIATCGNFVSLDRKQNVLRFEHYSVQEFLNQHEFKEAEPGIARSCLTILTLSEPPPDLYLYVAEHWQEHARFWKDTADLTDPIEQFLFDKSYLQSWARYISKNPYRSRSWLQGLKLEPIHLICHFDLMTILRYFFQRQLQNSETPQVLSEALALAGRSRRSEVVEFLLNEYPQVDLEKTGMTRRRWLWPPLQRKNPNNDSSS